MNNEQAMLHDKITELEAVVPEVVAELDRLTQTVAVRDARIAALEKELRLAVVRLRICHDRFYACEIGTPDSHRVSLVELPAWIADHNAALAPTPAAPEVVACPTCGGKGYAGMVAGVGMIDCPACNGTGRSPSAAAKE